MILMFFEISTGCIPVQGSPAGLCDECLLFSCKEGAEFYIA